MNKTTWVLLGAFALLLVWRGSKMLQPVSSLKTSAAGVAAIKRFEGWRSTVYRDAVNKATIGWGHLIKPGEVMTSITVAQGEALLAADIAAAEASVRRLVLVPITQGQFDALVSFVFNLGAGNLQTSTLLRKLNARDYLGAAAELPRWKLAGGKELPGLVARRAEERTWFEATA